MSGRERTGGIEGHNGRGRDTEYMKDIGAVSVKESIGQRERESMGEPERERKWERKRERDRERDRQRERKREPEREILHSAV